MKLGQEKQSKMIGQVVNKPTVWFKLFKTVEVAADEVFGLA